MCNSSSEGKNWTKTYVNRYLSNVPNPKFLDIGTGKGTYWDLLAQSYPNSHWTGVEAYQQYIDTYKLNDKYDLIFNEDARKLYSQDKDLSQLSYNIVFCGDVLEHMTKDEALALTGKITTCCELVIVSIPIIHWPQHGGPGHPDPNPYQEHVKDDWSHEEFMDTFNGHNSPKVIDWYKGVSIGVYVLAGDHYISKW